MRRVVFVQIFEKSLFNKTLRYHEELSASVVLSRCVLGHFSREKLLMDNQPLSQNWPRKPLSLVLRAGCASALSYWKTKLLSAACLLAI